MADLNLLHTICICGRPRKPTNIEADDEQFRAGVRRHPRLLGRNALTIRAEVANADGFSRIEMSARPNLSSYSKM